MSDLRIECPSCKTQYTAERCGVPIPKHDQRTVATVACVLCHAQFDVIITPNPGPGWWARTVLRRTTPEHTVRSVSR